jgi:hypothetical protein
VCFIVALVPAGVPGGSRSLARPATCRPKSKVQLGVAPPPPPATGVTDSAGSSATRAMAGISCELMSGGVGGSLV